MPKISPPLSGKALLICIFVLYIYFLLPLTNTVFRIFLQTYFSKCPLFMNRPLHKSCHHDRKHPSSAGYDILIFISNSMSNILIDNNFFSFIPTPMRINTINLHKCDITNWYLNQNSIALWFKRNFERSNQPSEGQWHKTFYL